MARIAKFTEKTVETAQLYVKEAETARDLRTGLSILIPKIFGASNANAAEVLGVPLCQDSCRMNLFPL